VWNDDENEFQWESQSFIFDAGHSTGSVTKKTCFANMNFLGDKHRPFILVDTPGHDDPDSADLETKKARGVLMEHAADLYLKLKMMKHVNLILIMHNDVHSNRINPATLELLKKVGEMFQGSESSVWNHVALAYTKCDADSVAWRDQISQKKCEMQSAIRSKFPACTEQARLPIFALSGVSVEGSGTDLLKRNFESLWQEFSALPALSTECVRKFEGLDVKLERIIKCRDNAIRVAEARKEFQAVLFNLVLLVVSLLFRSLCLPCTHVPGVLDELLLVGVLVYCMGVCRVADWGAVCWDDHVLPALTKHAQLDQKTQRSLQILAYYDHDHDQSGSSSRHIEAPSTRKYKSH
jgi:hypothetical protein